MGDIFGINLSLGADVLPQECETIIILMPNNYEVIKCVYLLVRGVWLECCASIFEARVTSLKNVVIVYDTV